MGDKAPLDSENQQTPLGFVENVDFIGFDDSDQEAGPANQQGASAKSKKDKKAQPRGTKRKLGAVVTEEQADAVRKKKGLIITPWFDRLLWKGRNVQQMLTAEIGSFVAYIQPTYEEHELRQMIIQLIRDTVQSRWPDADVEPFGSFGTKLYLPAGDIDLVIISTQMMNEQKSRILYKLAPLIRENNIGQDVVVIAKAKVPIIKFKTIFGNINVDISINQTNGIIAMKKVNELLDDVKCLSIDFASRSARHRRDLDEPSSSSRKGRNDSRRQPRASSLDLSEDEKAVSRVVEELGAAKCLILVVKSVLKQRGMNEVYTGGLGSYSIICLVVSFLQLHPKIQRGDIDPNKNLGVLLLEFFELYGKHFNFDQTGISVRKGGFYFSKAHRGWQRERQPYLLSIEDPADESNDIAGGSHNILSVRTVFAGAFDLLSATLYHRHSIQSSRDAAFDDCPSRPLLSVPVPKQQQQQSTDDDRPEGSTDPMAESLLGEIMGVTKELVENRKKNLKLFHSGTLQRLLKLPPPPPAGSAESSSRMKTNDASRTAGDRSNQQRSSQAVNAESRSDRRSRSSSPVALDQPTRERRKADDVKRDGRDARRGDDRDTRRPADRDSRRPADRAPRRPDDRETRRPDDRDPRRRAHAGQDSNRETPKVDTPGAQSRRQLVRYDDGVVDSPSVKVDDRDSRRGDQRYPTRGTRADPNPSREAPRADHPASQSRRQPGRADDRPVPSPREAKKKADKKGKRKASARNSPPPLWVEDVEPSEVEVLKRFPAQTPSSTKPGEEAAVLPSDDLQSPIPAPRARRPSSTPSIEIAEPVRKNGTNGLADQDHELVDSKYRAISAPSQSHKQMATSLRDRITSPPRPSSSSLLLDEQSLLAHHQARGLAYFVDDDSDSQFSEPGQIGT
ncbi:hypothetical protein PtA15_7A70 [Puccinia triticina]|uniref:polynucleotide adenylyltransferase n=1 Tax=Puccinia triticina TaxID=208348 RepID=A0ABY7CME6_9BASI|nr:uncharacterized protein PtA15_7A70 [Puccinia triticina]WAQ86344.1 hypothetical protein PtA15_7A70 [Puccinia triticina]